MNNFLNIFNGIFRSLGVDHGKLRSICFLFTQDLFFALFIFELY